MVFKGLNINKRNRKDTQCLLFINSHMQTRAVPSFPKQGRKQLFTVREVAPLPASATHTVTYQGESEFAASQKTDDISVSFEMEEKLLTYPNSNRALKHSTD